MVDNITRRELRQISIEDIDTFVEAKARFSSHPILGNLSNGAKEDRKDENRT